jgi:hypothetical protein
MLHTHSRETKPENGKRNVAEMAPNQVKTRGSLRAIFDSGDVKGLREFHGSADHRWGSLGPLAFFGSASLG